MKRNDVTLRPRSPEAVVAYYEGQITEIKARAAGLRDELERTNTKLRIAEGMRDIAIESKPKRRRAPSGGSSPGAPDLNHEGRK